MCDYEMEESTEGVDRLSELPLELIHSILSFLPTRDVVSTTFLSKRWKNLWATVPCLSFRDDYDEQNFVNRVLTSWKGTKIKKFEIEIVIEIQPPELYNDMDLWLQFAMEKEVAELNIYLHYDPEEDVYWVPHCLYSCSSLTKLQIVGCNLENYEESPLWNQLKSLTIDNVFLVSDSSINSILSGSPRLEVFELSLMGNNEDVNILSPSLKKLKIGNHYSSSPRVLTICCPNLETLEISGALYSKCLFKDISSLTDATIGFYTSLPAGLGDKVHEDVLRQIFSTLQHLEKLTLSYSCVRALGELKNKHLVSPLQNVKFLKLDDCTLKLDDMVDFLGIFPNLKMLVITCSSLPDVEYDANLSNSSLLHQLKAVDISTPSPLESSIFSFFDLLLKRASMLEKLVIRVRDVVDSYDSHQCLSEVAEALQKSCFQTAEAILKIE